LPGTVFKVVVDGGDWGSPIANEAAFDNLEEAQAEAHSYLEQQRKAGASLGVTIEKKAQEMARSRSTLSPSRTPSSPALPETAASLWASAKYRASVLAPYAGFLHSRRPRRRRPR
jgi:hypothetical protein